MKDSSRIYHHNEFDLKSADFEHFFLPKSCYEKWSFFNFYLVTQNTKMTISTKDTDEIFFSAHFLMPLGIPFHKYMVSNRSIFFYFLAPQTHRDVRPLIISAQKKGENFGNIRGYY